MSVLRALFYLFFPFINQGLNALLYYVGFSIGADEHTPSPSFSYLVSVTIGTAILFAALYGVLTLTLNSAAFASLFPSIFEPSQGLLLHNMFKGTFWMVLVASCAHIFIIGTGTLVGIKRSSVVVIIANALSYIITFGVLKFIA